MKFLFLSLALSALYACQRDELPAAGVKFEYSPEPDPATPAEKDWRYAKYKFSLDKYKDVLVAVRVAVNEDNEATHLEVKDLTAGKEDWEVEMATLMGEVNADGNYAFSGTSELQEGGTDYGGKYSGTLTVTDDSVAENGCCGEMTFTSTEQGKLTATGTKEAEDFSADDWEWDDDVDMSAEPAPADPSACEDFKLVFSGLKDVRRGEKFDFTVAAKTCDDGQTDNFNGKELTMEWRYDGEQWFESRISGKKLDENSTRTHEDYNFVIGDNSKKRYQFKASVEKDGAPYATESDAFDLNPAIDVKDSCTDGNYELKVSKQPMNAKAGARITFEVTLECDGAIVSDIAKDKAASAPITMVKYKMNGMGDWTDSALKKTAGALGAGKKEFKLIAGAKSTDLQYMIGVTINGEIHEATTNKFDITE